jgi:aminopeptidase N
MLGRRWIVYSKGGWVLHMLRRVVGDTVFFQATRNYMSDSTLVYGNALTVDFQRHFENVLGGSTSMAWFFNEWLTQANRPNYTISWGSHLSGVTTYADLRITQTQTSATYIMPLDFRINFTDSSNTTVTVWNTQYARQDFHVPVGISKTVSSVVFDPDNWVLKNSNITQLREWDNY